MLSDSTYPSLSKLELESWHAGSILCAYVSSSFINFNLELQVDLPPCSGWLKSAEMYDTSAGQWRSLPDMSVARCGCAAVCIEGNVYVVGGEDGATKHASVECYDPVASEWCTLPSMSTAKEWCAAATAEIHLG